MRCVGAADLVSLVTVQVRTLDIEAGDVTNVFGGDVPLASDLRGIPPV